MDQYDLIDEVRGEAEPRILAKYPLWKQLNLITGVLEQLADKAGLEVPEFREMRAHIEGTLAYCNELEARAKAGEQFDPCEGWPTEFKARKLDRSELVRKNLEVMAEDGIITPAEAMLDELEAVKTKIDEGRPIDPLDPSEEPPEAIADLFDPSLTPRQNQDALKQKYAQHMSEHYRLRDYGDQDSKSQAQRHLEKAERLDSGIKWNRARLAEVI